MPRSLRFAVLVPLAILAFYVMFVLPGIDLGWGGSLALLAGAWLVWYLLWSALRQLTEVARLDESVSTPSPGELRAWVGAVFVAGILLFYILHGTQMVAPDGGMAPAAHVIARHLVLLVLGWLVVVRVMRTSRREPVMRDERDRVIRAYASRWARIGLSVFVFALAVMLALTPLPRLDWAQPMVLSNTLMIGLIAATLLRYVVAVTCYWSDRH